MGDSAFEVDLWAWRDLPNREEENLRVRSALGKALGKNPDELEIETMPSGKPRLADRSLQLEYNVTHSGAWLVVATSAAEIGVDIETRLPRTPVLTLATRFFSASDTALLAAVEGAQRNAFFLSQWVAKEAALKAVGTGIAGHLHRLECDLEDGRIVAIRWDELRLSIEAFVLPDGTPGAVACMGERKIALRWRS